MTRTKEPSQVLADAADGGRQVPVVPLLDQVGDDLGVGLGLVRSVAALLEAVHERLEVLDGAVVDDGDRARAVERAGGRCGRSAAPCVAQRVWPMPSVPASSWLLEHLLELGQLAGLALDVERAVGAQDRDAGAVVAAVLDPAQAAEHDLERLLLADVAHDAAHGARG